MNESIGSDALAAANRLLKGRVAVLTGSAAGIGLGIAETVSLQGASLVLCAMMHSRLRSNVSGKPTCRSKGPTRSGASWRAKGRWRRDVRSKG